MTITITRERERRKRQARECYISEVISGCSADRFFVWWGLWVSGFHHVMRCDDDEQKEHPLCVCALHGVGALTGVQQMLDNNCGALAV